MWGWGLGWWASLRQRVVTCEAMYKPTSIQVQYLTAALQLQVVDNKRTQRTNTNNEAKRNATQHNATQSNTTQRRAQIDRRQSHHQPTVHHNDATVTQSQRHSVCCPSHTLTSPKKILFTGYVTFRPDVVEHTFEMSTGLLVQSRRSGSLDERRRSPTTTTSTTRCSLYSLFVVCLFWSSVVRRPSFVRAERVCSSRLFPSGLLL